MADLFGDKTFDATDASVARAMGWQSVNSNELGQSVADRQHAEQWIKVVEAQEKAKLKGEPANVQEREARCSEAYRLALEAYRDASAHEQKLRYTWEFAQTVADVWRTKCANERKV